MSWKPKPEFQEHDLYHSYGGKVIYDSTNNKFITVEGEFTGDQCVRAVCGYAAKNGLNSYNVQLDHIVPDILATVVYPGKTLQGIYEYEKLYMTHSKLKNTKYSGFITPGMEIRVQLLRGFKPVSQISPMITHATPLKSLAFEHAELMRSQPYVKGRYKLVSLSEKMCETEYLLSRSTIEPTSPGNLRLEWCGKGGGMAGRDYSIGTHRFIEVGHDADGGDPIFILYFENKFVDFMEVSRAQVNEASSLNMIGPFFEVEPSTTYEPRMKLWIQIIQRCPKSGPYYFEICSVWVEKPCV